MKSLPLALIAAALSTSALAAQPGHWSSAMGMDGQTMNYSVSDAKGNNLTIFCGKEPATMSAAINKNEYAPESMRSNYGKGDFVMIIDGKKLMPSDAGSNAGGDNFRYAWEAIRAGKKIVVKGGRNSMILPVEDAAKVLPPLQRSHCETW